MARAVGIDLGTTNSVVTGPRTGGGSRAGACAHAPQHDSRRGLRLPAGNPVRRALDPGAGTVLRAHGRAR